MFTAIIIIIIGAIIAISITIFKALKNNSTNQQNKKNPQPKPVNDPCETLDWEQHHKVIKFWDDASEYISSYIRARELDLVSELILNIWNTRERAEHAEDLHRMLNHALNESYPLRYSSDAMFRFVLFVCDLDISNIENYAKVAVRRPDGLCFMPSVEKKAIILEKSGQLEEAIFTCDKGIEYRVLDSGYKRDGYGSFEARKMRLVNKISKHRYDIEDVFGDN